MAVIAGGLLAAPLAAEGQQAGNVYRVGYLGGQSESAAVPFLAPFRQGMHKLGYVEGQNLMLVTRFAEGKFDRFPSLAQELVHLNPDVLFVATSVGARAAKAATATIPIVFVEVGDPVGVGLVPNLARPGGNITGITDMMVELTGKRLELLKEMVPTASRIAVLVNPDAPIAAAQIRNAEAAARTLGVQLHPVLTVRDAGTLRGSFEAAVRSGASAALRLVDFTAPTLRVETAKLAVKHRLPVMYPFREDVDVGGLVAYGPSRPAQYQQAATFVQKILRGAKPGDLPVEQPTKFDLLINLKTAKALGLTIPNVAPAAGGSGDRVMDRRVFISGAVAALLAAPLAAEAQQPGKIYRIGFLSPTSPSDRGNPGRLGALQEGLRELGYTEGQNILIESRWAEGKYERLSSLATELVRLKVDVIVTYSPPAIQAAKQATATIPIVMAGVIDPVATGIVTSLARPGGNVTGLSLMAPELVGKQLEIVKEVVPIGLPGGPPRESRQPGQRATGALRAGRSPDIGRAASNRGGAWS